MDCQDTNPKQFDKASMLHPDTIFSRNYPREVFAIGDGSDDLGYHDDDPANSQGPSAPVIVRNNPYASTTPPALIGALVKSLLIINMGLTSLNP